MEQYDIEIWPVKISKKESERLKQLAEKILMKRQNIDDPEVLKKKYAQDFEYYQGEPGLVETRKIEDIIDPQMKKRAKEAKEINEKIEKINKELEKIRDDLWEAMYLKDLGQVKTEEIENLTEEEKNFLAENYSRIDYAKNNLSKLKEAYAKKQQEKQVLMKALINQKAS